MKVAICFAGIPYYIRQNQRYWQELIEKHDADVYASLWDEENVYQEGDTIEAFKKAYNPVKLEVENQSAFLKSFASINQEYVESPEYFTDAIDFAHKNGRPYSTLYKIWRANLFASEGDYDVIVRAETSSSYPDMEIVEHDSISLPYWHHVYPNGPVRTVNLNNWVAFGPPYLMDYYCSAFLKLRKYYDECFVQPVESIINHHLFQRPNIQLRFFFSRIYRKGVINWNGGKYNEKVILPEPWYDTVGRLGGSDEQHDDGNWTGKDTFDTCFLNKKGAETASVKMAKGPVNITKPDITSKKEDSYQKVHGFSATDKAKLDFSRPTLDEDGNWNCEDNWIQYEKTMNDYN
jgi:hypothetical protein